MGLTKRPPTTHEAKIRNTTATDAYTHIINISGQTGHPASGFNVANWPGPEGRWYSQYPFLHSFFIMLGVLVGLTRSTILSYWPRGARTIAWAPVARMLRLGVPLGLQFGLEVWAFHAAGLMIGQLGGVPLAAHAIAINLATLSFMIPSGIAAAGATRVGNLVGAGDHTSLTTPFRRWMASPDCTSQTPTQAVGKHRPAGARKRSGNCPGPKRVKR